MNGRGDPAHGAETSGEVASLPIDDVAQQFAVHPFEHADVSFAPLEGKRDVTAPVAGRHRHRYVYPGLSSAAVHTCSDSSSSSVWYPGRWIRIT